MIKMLGKDPIPNYLSFQYAATSRSRQKPNDTESGENGSRRCSGRISFSWFSYRTLSLPLRYRNRSFASRSGIPLRPSSKKSAISNFDVSYPIQEETVLSERIRGCRETANEICTDAFSYTIDHSMSYPAVL